MAGAMYVSSLSGSLVERVMMTKKEDVAYSKCIKQEIAGRRKSNSFKKDTESWSIFFFF